MALLIPLWQNHAQWSSVWPLYNPPFNTKSGLCSTKCCILFFNLISFPLLSHMRGSKCSFLCDDHIYRSPYVPHIHARVTCLWVTLQNCFSSKSINNFLSGFHNWSRSDFLKKLQICLKGRPCLGRRWDGLCSDVNPDKQVKFRRDKWKRKPRRGKSSPVCLPGQFVNCLLFRSTDN